MQTASLYGSSKSSPRHAREKGSRQMEKGDAVVVTGSGFGFIVEQDEKTTRVRFLTGTEEDVDSRYVEPAAPSLAEQIKAKAAKQE